MKEKIIVEQENEQQMYKFFFVLMKPGRVKMTNREGKSVIWNVPIKSKVKFVKAFDMPNALHKMRKQMKKQWIGFQVLDVKECEL